MQMISEKTIDHIIGQFEDEVVDYETTAEEFADRQPAILSFLLSEQEGALTDDERDFMLYLAIVIWQSVEHISPIPSPIDPKKISDAEEANWGLMDKAKGLTFRDRLDVFFKNSPQEDLLAFIEDSLTLDEVEDGETGIQVTQEGAEPMFVMLKTVVDVLTGGSL
ncbi:MAG: hypothetical protein R2825_27620 [Saprospiraceae bacterium]